MEELKELHGEGGSDVFTSTRHVNPNAVSIVILTKYFSLSFDEYFFCSITGTKHKRLQDEVLEQR